MTRRKVWRWFAASIVGIMLAVCAGLWFLPGTGPRGSVLAVEMAPIRTESGEVWRPAPAPAIVTQEVPEFEDLPEDYGEHWDRTHDRADWVGGATVTCELGDLADNAVTAHLDMDKGIRLEGTVDVMSRMYTPIEDGRVTFAVKEPEGEARLMLGIVDDETLDIDELDGPPDFEAFGSRPLRVRWHGADEGTTVGCDGVWAVETGSLAIRIVDTSGADVEPGPASMAIVRGCGVMVPLAMNPVEFEVEAGTCALQLERRAANFPLVVSRSQPESVQIAPGEVREITLTLPDPPPLYQPPDLLELATAADVAAFFGADVAADAIEAVIERVLAGDWDEDLMARIAERMSGVPPIDDEDMEIVLEGEMSDSVAELIELQEERGMTVEIVETEEGRVVEMVRPDGTRMRVEQGKDGSSARITPVD